MATASEKTVVEVSSRNDMGKNACRRLRAEGLVPANVYGLDLGAFAVTVPERRVGEILALETGQNTLVTLKLPDTDDSRQVMIREMQRDPVTGRLVHVDFVRVDPDKEIHVQVPVRLIGVPDGVKNEGGILDFVHREVAVACLPAAIPEHFDVDVSELHIGQNVSVKDVTPPEGATMLDEPDTILAVVSVSRAEVAAEAEEAEAEEAAAAEGEPEVIKKGKEGEEGQEADKG